ncbi:PIN domain-containing protein [Candidatus Woesearchaeota archaeon]|nr:PIN domain-containing protein [Candidatus Woesearchaeota archaeon]
MVVKCLDTYALVEIYLGNPNFTRFFNEEVIISDLTLAEFYGDLYRKYNEKTAEYWFRKLSNISQIVPKEILIKAIKYRIDNKKQNLSFFDCVGYIFALENGIKFVTGDKEFKDKEGVEFVK